MEKWAYVMITTLTFLSPSLRLITIKPEQLSICDTGEQLGWRNQAV